METKRLALFDFDGTMSKGESIVPFLFYCIARGMAPKRQLLRAAGGWLGQLIDPKKAGPAKEKTLSFIKGRSVGEMNDFARDFFRDIIMPNHLFPQAKAELERLKAEGWTVLVVTASTDVYMNVLPDFLPVDGVIATRCGVDRKGCYTGAVDANCRGEEKAERLERYFRGRGWKLDPENSRAYGNSKGDIPMLKMTAHPVLVNPPAKLLAQVPGCEQIRWSV